MLPWKRRKFVLAGDESKNRAKSLGPGLACHSLLSSLLRSCPDLLPERPLRCLAAVFQSRRCKVELNREEPAHSVRYLGSVVTVVAKGEGCTLEAVAKLWASSNYGEHSAKMRLTVGPHGIRMGAGSGEGGRRRPAHLYTISRITYCAADPSRPKILAWVYRHQVKHKAVVLRCHAALLAKAEKVRTIALSLRQNSASAFSEFKRLKRQSDFRHRQQQLLGDDVVPLVPLRRLLKGHCHYQPLADGLSNAAHLSSITEEDEEEEEEEEEEEGGEEEGKKEEKQISAEAPDPVPERPAEPELRCIVHGLDEFSITIRDEVHMTVSTLV
ncbi:protein FAM43B isoform X2 [Electrophorus electricus]|uniref:PID domain-containing protein n=1 Tax=Electrophorus electricus TaxID=8005 RepID=A0A4W4DX08_ELEEL|nr:protein FAM43B isoform X2 [Electrophorus electricus]